MKRLDELPVDDVDELPVDDVDETPISDTGEQPIPHVNEIQQLIQRAQSGDTSCLPALRTLLKDKPELWQTVGDLAQHSEMTLSRLIVGNDLLGSESLRLKQAELRKQLSGPSPCRLEKLLIDRVCASHLQVYHADLDAAKAASRGDGPMTVYAQRRLDSAQKRYLHAIQQLAMVRKLLKKPDPTKKKSADADGKGKRPRGRRFKKSNQPEREIQHPNRPVEDRP